MSLTHWYPSTLEIKCTRLTPGTDLKTALTELASSGISGCIVTCTGSLTQTTLRLAGASEVRSFNGPFEILSLSGTLSPDGVHLHICVSDASGQCIGGHLLNGSVIATTAEIVIGIANTLQFSRPHDPATGYRELSIQD